MQGRVTNRGRRPAFEGMLPMILQRMRIRWSHWLSIGRRNVEGRDGAKRTNLLSGLGVTRRAGRVA